MIAVEHRQYSMSEERSTTQRLHDIRENMEFIMRTVDSTSSDVFFSDVLYPAAVSQAFVIIGEASKYIPNNLRTEYPHIPWDNMINYGNFLLSEYRRVTPEDVWDKANNLIPKLYNAISQMIVNVEREQEIL